nr:alkaline phosphatase family protein [Planctomycetota bacterium]
RALLTGRRPDLLTGFRNFNARPVDGSIVGYAAERGAHTAHAGDAAAFQFCKDHYRGEDVLQFPDQGPTDQGESDLKSIAFILERIEEVAPHVVTVHLTYPDHAGHKFGAIGYEYWHACRTVDDQIRRVTELFLAKHDHGVVLIAADHGVSPMGTHGGGEASAKRAPFALVGPGVARAGPLELDQCALAPTVCALLGLPQPPLADAPPARELMELPDPVEVAAIDAYVRARLEVAKNLGSDVDFVERRRAELAVERSDSAEARRLLSLAMEVNAAINPSAAGDATLALLLAALWLVGAVHLASVGRTRLPRGRVAFVAAWVGFLLTFDPVPGLVPVGPRFAALIAIVVTALAVAATVGRRVRGAVVTLACLAAVPVLTGAGLTLQRAYELTDDLSAATTRLTIFGAVLLAVLLLFVRPKAVGRRLLDETRVAPGLIAAFGGSVLGFTLTLRPFIDPFLHLMVVYAVLALLVVVGVLISTGGRARSLRLRVSILVVGLALFVATRIAEGVIGQVWVNATPKVSDPWLLVGVVGVGAVLAFLRWREVDRRDLPGLLLAGFSLVLAFFLRLRPEQALTDQFGTNGYLVLTIGTSGLAIAALVYSVARGSAEGRMAVRMIAALALARRLSVMDAEFAVFGVVAVGGVLVARMPVPTTRVRLAWMAVGILALRTAIFHAMGFEESFSTLDVGQAFTGLGTGEAQALDAAGGIVISWQIVVAGIQLAVRMALPWLVILASVTRAFEATPDAPDGALRVMLQDLAISYAARGAAILTALWAWWRSSWWMTHAYTVYAFGAADVLLLLACATLAGSWRKRTAPAPEPAPVPRPAPA